MNNGTTHLFRTNDLTIPFSATTVIFRWDAPGKTEQQICNAHEANVMLSNGYGLSLKTVENPPGQAPSKAGHGKKAQMDANDFGSSLFDVKIVVKNIHGKLGSAKAAVYEAVGRILGFPFYDPTQWTAIEGQKVKDVLAHLEGLPPHENNKVPLNWKTPVSSLSRGATATLATNRL